MSAHNRRIIIRKIFIKDTILYTLGEVLNKSSKFFLIPFYTRVMTQADFGILEMILIIQGLLSIIIDFGSSQCLLRFYYDPERDLSKMITWLLVLPLGIGIASCGVLWALSYFGLLMINGVSYYLFSLLLVLYSVFYSWITTGLTLARVKRKLAQYISINLLYTILELVFIVFCIKLLFMGVMGKVVGSLLASSFLLIPIFVTLLSKQLTTSLPKETRTEIIHFSWPIVLQLYIGWLFISYDKILLNIYYGAEKLAVLAIASQLLQAFKLVMTGFTKNFNVHLYENFDKLKNSFNTSFTLILSFSVIVAAFICLFSKEVLLVLAPASFQGAAVIVSILIISRILSVVTEVLRQYMFYFKKTKNVLVISIFSGVFMVGVSYALIPRLGFLGIYLSSIIVSLSLFALHYFALKKELPISLSSKDLVITLLFLCIVGVSLTSLPFLVRLLILIIFIWLMYLINRKILFPCPSTTNIPKLDRV